MMTRGKTAQDFIDKFKGAKTTDECYTPSRIYDVVKNWAVERYGIDERAIVRPFMPGGDYYAFDYSDGCVVLDNPPFSMIGEIVKFYLKRGIKFFLFAPGLTTIKRGCCAVLCGAEIVYENGAKVNTNFLTNLEAGMAVCISPSLNKILTQAMKDCQKLKKKKEVDEFSLPFRVLTAARGNLLAKHGQKEILIRQNECVFVRAIGSEQKILYGGGYIISSKWAKEVERIESISEKKYKEEKIKQAILMGDLYMNKRKQRRKIELSDFEKMTALKLDEDDL